MLDMQKLQLPLLELSKGVLHERILVKAEYIVMTGAGFVLQQKEAKSEPVLCLGVR